MRASAPKILSYADRLSVAPGEEIEFKVSCLGPGAYDASVVRLGSADGDPVAPGVKERTIPTSVAGTHPARRQAIDLGSLVVVEHAGRLATPGSFTLHAFVQPTTPDRDGQTVLGCWDAEAGLGRALGVGPEGVELWLGDGSRVVRVATGVPLYRSCWYSAAAAFDAASMQATVTCTPVVTSTNSLLGPVAETPGAAAISASVDVAPGSPAVPFTVGGAVSGPGRFDAHYNGKVERPSVWGRCLSREELAALAAAPSARPRDVLASWDFSAGIEQGAMAGDAVADVGPHGLDGTCVNGPARAMTGVTWDGGEDRYTHAPAQYGAIHFHEDDLEDCGWDTDVSWRVTDDLPSGVYALRIEHDGAVDRLPFWVLPPRGTATAELALVVPTASYLAYANEGMGTGGPLVQSAIGHTPVLDPVDLHLHEHPDLGLSLYDLHADGSGTHLSSALRPIVNLRPDKRTCFDGPWQLSADLHLVDWLERKGIAYDVVTDLELHREGVALLARYRAVISGSHPEYVSAAMLDAWEQYLAGGGRALYLGANGFYWVTNWHPTKPHQIEVRRGESGVRAWEALPGELHLQTSGERGGLWRWRGRPPQKLFGVGFAAQGFDRSSWFVPAHDATEPRSSFVFDGVDLGERIGDFGLVGGGAAGYELDRYDLALGTPPATALLAYSAGHSDVYQRAVEELSDGMVSSGATMDHKARGDLVYFPTQAGGGVFSAGSIAWCGSLSHREYDNDVSRITENVVRRFLDPAPLP